MEKFTTTTSNFVVIPIENIDTDQIIPARFLKAVTKEGFGDNLFRDWRFDANNSPLANPILSETDKGVKILVAGKNFGCGSSREHAAWALHGYGFRIVISSFFADIFKNNALNNHILPIQVSDAFLSEIIEAQKQNKQAQLKIDLVNQTVELVNSGSQSTFEIPLHKKTCLLNGLDDTKYLLSKKNAIQDYEKNSMYHQIIF
jgi:3-isopropylmalate/(R)-2-methylmalate dehydratase small subunit